MSLAPGERSALSRIERELRRSDPGLAAKLEQFRLSRWRSVAWQLSWPLRRLPRTLVVSVLTAACLGLVVPGLALMSHTRPARGLSCAQPSAVAGWALQSRWAPDGSPPAAYGSPPAAPSAAQAATSYPWDASIPGTTAPHEGGQDGCAG